VRERLWRRRLEEQTRETVRRIDQSITASTGRTEAFSMKLQSKIKLKHQNAPLVLEIETEIRGVGAWGFICNMNRNEQTALISLLTMTKETTRH
jgi:hypothetical protein